MRPGVIEGFARFGGRKAALRCLALGALVSFASLSGGAHAQDATWSANPVNNSFDNPANWSTNAVPTGVATFGASSITTITLTQPRDIGQLSIPALSDYVFNINTGNAGPINIVGAGIDRGANAVTINLVAANSVLNFYNNANLAGGPITINATGPQTEVHFFGNSGDQNLLGTILNLSNGSTATTNDDAQSPRTVNVGNDSKLILNSYSAPSFITISGNGRVEWASATAMTQLGSLTFSPGSTGRFVMSQHMTITEMNGPGTIEFTSGGLILRANGRRNTSLFSGIIQGPGRLEVTFGHRMILSGANTYTDGTYISGSSSQQGPTRLELGNGGTTGSVVGNIYNGAVLILNRSDNYIFPNLVSNFNTLVGQFIHEGTGNATVTANNTYTGLTTINAGTLTIQGSIAASSGVVVNNNGTLAGTGFVPGITINSGGILSPGTTSGVLNATGNVTFQPGSLLAITVAPTISTRVDITGTAALAGSVQVSGANVNYGTSQRTTILHATGGVTGTFAGVTDNLAFYNSSLSYDANNVFLTLTSNTAANFTSNANTPNERAIAAALDGASTSSALVQALQTLTVEQLQTALRLLSGEAYASTPTVLLNDSGYLRNMIFSRLRTTAFSGASGPLGYLSEQPEQQDVSLAYAPRRANPFAQLTPKRVPQYEFWAQGYGSWANLHGDNNAAGAKRTTGGMVSGVDKLFNDNLRAGLAAGYSRTSVNVSDRASKMAADTFHLAAYFSSLHNNWSYRGGVVGAVHNLNSERNVLGSTLKADYYAYTGQVFGEIGYAFTRQQVAFEPFANISGVYHHTGAFNETGGIGALNSQGDDRFAGFVTTGLRMATRYNLENGWAFMPKAMLGWQHALGPLATTSTLVIDNTGTSFAVRGAPGARDSLLAELGFDLRINPNTVFGLTYQAAASTSSTEHTGRGTFGYKF